MLNDWKGRTAIDATGMGFFGFSLGGYAGLVLAGAKPDAQRVAARCTERTGACEELHNGVILPDLPHEARIKAAVLADAALTTAFTQEALTGIQIPLQVWRSELGGNGVDAGGTARVASVLPGKPEIHVVPAGHYAFLAPYSPQLAAAVPRICTDAPPGFDRAAFHRDFNVSVIRSFRKHLVDDGRTP
jgi:predicted dienelactone hydrolase